MKISVLVVLLTLYLVEGRQQRVAVYGQLNCRNKPYPNATVKIYNKNMLIDKLIDKQVTDNEGKFKLDGTGSDLITDIDPVLYIYHKCNKGALSCKREVIYTIPDEFVFDVDAKNFEAVNFGVTELMLSPKEEETKCLPVVKKEK